MNKAFNEDLFKRLLDAANGDGVVLTKLSLQNAMELGDIPEWAMKYFKLAEKVNNFQHAKKASIETRIDDFRRIEFHMVNQDIYGDIAQIHKRDPALIDKIVEAEFTEIVNGEKNALEVVEQHLNKVEKDEK